MQTVHFFLHADHQKYTTPMQTLKQPIQLPDIVHKDIQATMKLIVIEQT